MLKRKDTEVPQPSGPTTSVVDEAVNEEMDDSLEKAATTATSLDAEQDKGNINKTQSKATPNEPSSPGTSSGGGPRRQDTMRDTFARTRFERVSKTSNDLLLAGVNTSRSGEDSMKLKELIDFFTKLQQRVLDLENIKTTQGNEIASLKRRVKKLERKDRKRAHKLKRLYKVGLSARVVSSEDEGLGKEDASKQGRIDDIVADAEITLSSTHFDADTDMFGVHDLDGDEVIVESVDVVKTAEETVNDAATTVSVATITKFNITLAQALAELKSSKPKATTTLITIAATTITAASTRPRAKGIIILKQEQAPTPTFSSQQPSQVKDKGKGKMVEPKKPVKRLEQIRLDEELAFKLQAREEKEERLAREKVQQVEEVNIAWDNVQAKVEADYQLALRLQGQDQEELTNAEKARLFNAKKQKEDDDQEAAKMKELMKIVLDEEEVAIDAIHLATKPPTIMLRSFDREDLENLWKLVKVKHGSTRPEEGYERGRIVGIKSLLEVTAAKVRVTTAKQNLVLLSNLNEKYAKYTVRVKLVLLVKIEENILSSYYCLYTVNVAGTKVTTTGIQS
ncbi:hypothetical protein Tco_0534336 [Tanacetum coccineum]